MTLKSACAQNRNCLAQSKTQDSRQKHIPPQKPLSEMPSAALFFVLILGVVVAVVTSEQDMKRSFSGLGCMGVYDKAKFARLDRVCEECYQLFRESDVHTLCRSNCFKNNFFTQCVDALLLQKDQQRLDTMVEELYGKR
ncbi:ion transport peptide-like [Caerostris darwini]|uniref:Ion transport peptide-like n=1 Tax=Caerostris darwini TaxID=1538125 RepID=A0AAV4SLP2_9ARAC|nr:ion transport peptide-like [Caerostris darwini]